MKLSIKKTLLVVEKVFGDDLGTKRGKYVQKRITRILKKRFRNLLDIIHPKYVND